ncbi:GyrI-like domain-containing protein [Candidatus Oscillochloris fontis]|uniref:GyrI-like domain-containing protein n=1 Tax=Candidatus Oscillochloris fontis TaxID=2496868 RepID=UPI00101D694C|nr:GyrI-like domain-containing protein [Candidatus Oscillochloris fontis]
MQKIDIKQELKHLYQPSAKEVVQVVVPQMNYLMIDGTGDPNTSAAYQAAVEVLFAVAYSIKFTAKKGPLAIDYGVMPLEGLWWVEDMSHFSMDDRSDWKWTMMIMQPDFITHDIVNNALAEVSRKKGLPQIEEVRFTSHTEGMAAQIMHIGPFASEGPTIERLHTFIADAGYQRTGKHHEIYLSDIRRVEPAKWKTVIRQPMQ